jgi:hypothetical protein
VSGGQPATENGFEEPLSGENDAALLDSEIEDDEDDEDAEEDHLI